MRQGVRSLPFYCEGSSHLRTSPSALATTEPRACTSPSWARLRGVANYASEFVVPLMTNLLVLFANHPHLMHLGGAASILVLFAAMQDEIA